jgi:hypothetical protein
MEELFIVVKPSLSVTVTVMVSRHNNSDGSERNG